MVKKKKEKPKKAAFWRQMTTGNRITIPNDVVEKLGIQIGDYLYCTVRKEVVSKVEKDD